MTHPVILVRKKNRQACKCAPQDSNTNDRPMIAGGGGKRVPPTPPLCVVSAGTRNVLSCMLSCCCCSLMLYNIYLGQKTKHWHSFGVDKTNWLAGKEIHWEKVFEKKLKITIFIYSLFFIKNIEINFKFNFLKILKKIIKKFQKFGPLIFSQCLR